MNKMNKKGFTLIEMLVVIAIIAVLVAIIVPTVSKSTNKAKAAADAANLRSVAAQVAADYLDNDKVDTSYAATAKSIDASEVAVYDEGDEIAAYFIDAGSKLYSVDTFAEAAEDGVKPVAGSAVTSSGVRIH